MTRDESYVRVCVRVRWRKWLPYRLSRSSSSSPKFGEVHSTNKHRAGPHLQPPSAALGMVDAFGLVAGLDSVADGVELANGVTNDLQQDARARVGLHTPPTKHEPNAFPTSVPLDAQS